MSALFLLGEENWSGLRMRNNSTKTKPIPFLATTSAAEVVQVYARKGPFHWSAASILTKRVFNFWTFKKKTEFTHPFLRKSVLLFTPLFLKKSAIFHTPKILHFCRNEMCPHNKNTRTTLDLSAAPQIKRASILLDTFRENARRFFSQTTDLQNFKKEQEDALNLFCRSIPKVCI